MAAAFLCVLLGCDDLGRTFDGSADLADARQQRVRVVAGHAQLARLKHQRAVMHAVQTANLVLHFGRAVRTAEVLQRINALPTAFVGLMGCMIGVFCVRVVMMVMAAGAAFAVVMVMFVSVVMATGVVFTVVVMVLVGVVMAAGAAFAVVMMVFMGVVVRVLRLFVGDSLYLVWLGRHGVSLLQYMNTCSYVHVFILGRADIFVKLDSTKRCTKEKAVF